MVWFKIAFSSLNNGLDCENFVANLNEKYRHSYFNLHKLNIVLSVFGISLLACMI